MDMVMLGYFGIVVMLVLSVLGMPMAYAMCVVASIGLSITLGPINAATQTMFVTWEQASNFSLMSIPLFIFMGTIAYHTGIVGNLFVAFRRWIGFLPGGLAAAGIMAAAAFGAVTGSTAAASATMASTVIPELEKAGYDKGLSAGAIAASGGLAAIIPPSVFLIIYAVLTDQSAGQMFIATLGPGLLVTALFALYCIIRCGITPSLGPKQPSSTWKERIECLPSAIPVMVTFSVVIGTIYGGLATPTEAAALGVIGVIIIAAWMRRLNKKTIISSFRDGATMSGYLLPVYRGLAHVALSGHHRHHPPHGGRVRRDENVLRHAADDDVYSVPDPGLYSGIHIHSGADHALYVPDYSAIRSGCGMVRRVRDHDDGTGGDFSSGGAERLRGARSVLAHSGYDHL